MPERKTESELRCNPVFGGGISVVPPVIVWPGSTPASFQEEVTVKSTDCGPKEVAATEKGNWEGARAAARKSARDQARSAAEETCRPGCPERQSCNYLETRGTTVGPEERPDPENERLTQYRYEFTSVGTCQCE